MTTKKKIKKKKHDCKQANLAIEEVKDSIYDALIEADEASSFIFVMNTPEGMKVVGHSTVEETSFLITLAQRRLNAMIDERLAK